MWASLYMKWPSVICVGQFFQVFRGLACGGDTPASPGNERQYVLPGRQGAIGSVGCGATGPISSQRWRDGPISLLRKTIEKVGPTLCMIGKAMQAQHQAAAPRFEDREIEPVGANRPSRIRLVA